MTHLLGISSNDPKTSNEAWDIAKKIVDEGKEPLWEELANVTPIIQGEHGDGKNKHELQKITKSYGFSADESQKITLQTLLGTVTHLLKTNMSTKALVESVATKGGITGEIIKILDQENFPDIIRLALDGGFKKIGLLTEKLTL